MKCVKSTAALAIVLFLAGCVERIQLADPDFEAFGGQPVSFYIKPKPDAEPGEKNAYTVFLDIAAADPAKYEFEFNLKIEFSTKDFEYRFESKGWEQYAYAPVIAPMRTSAAIPPCTLRLGDFKWDGDDADLAASSFKIKGDLTRISRPRGGGIGAAVRFASGRPLS